MGVTNPILVRQRLRSCSGRSSPLLGMQWREGSKRSSSAQSGLSGKQLDATVSCREAFEAPKGWIRPYGQATAGPSATRAVDAELPQMRTPRGTAKWTRDISRMSEAEVGSGPWNRLRDACRVSCAV